MKRRQGLLAAAAACLTRGTPARGAAFLAATWNLRLNTPADGPDAWPLRRDAVAALIRQHAVDLLGTQEALADQLQDLDARLPGFARVGVGRDDGRQGGEHAAIYFRRARFEALAHGDFWLSETPDRPSKGWDARCCHRLCSWVRLRPRDGGPDFLVLCAHFDHEGEQARRESARLLLQRLQALADGAPAVVLADLNATPESEPLRLLRAGGLADARALSASPPEGPEGTFNGFQLEAPLRERIDHVLLHGRWQVLRYAALDARRDNGRYPSDHLPVLVQLHLPD